MSQTEENRGLNGANTISVAIETEPSLPPSGIPSMIVDPEQRMLHVLARDVYRGEGIIVDAGIFAGRSSEILTKALRERADSSKLASHRIKPVHSYDLGLCDGFMAGLLNEHYDAGLADGDSFLPILEKNLAPFSDMLTFHPGDITTEEAPGDIEILFLDVCKTSAVNLHLMREFLPRLTVGGILIQQDFVHEWLPWIHVYMGLLDDYFEHIGTYGSSTVYRLVKPIAIDLSVDYYETLEIPAIDKLIAKAMKPLTDAQKYLVKFAQGRMYVDKGAKIDARYIFEVLTTEYVTCAREIPHIPRPEHFQRYADAVGKPLW